MAGPSFHEKYMPTGGMRQKPGQSTRGDLLWNPIRRENAVINKEWLDAYMAPTSLIIVSPEGQYRYVETKEIQKDYEQGRDNAIITNEDYLSFLNRPTWNGVQYETAGHETALSYEAAAQSHTIMRQVPQIRDTGDMGLTLREEQAMQMVGHSPEKIMAEDRHRGILQANANYLKTQYEKGMTDALDLIMPARSGDLTPYEAEDKLDSVKLPEDNYAYSEGFIFIKKLLDETYMAFKHDDLKPHPLTKTLIEAQSRTGGEIDESGHVINTERMVIKR